MLSLRSVISLFFTMGSVIATITDCSQGLSVFKFTNLALTPDPPIAGQNVLMTVQFNNPGSPIDSGTVSTTITLNGLPFAPSTEALCTNTQCPLVSGPNDRSTNSTWQNSITGKVQSHIVWNDLDGHQLLCIDITEKMFALRGSLTQHKNTHKHTHKHAHTDTHSKNSTKTTKTTKTTNTTKTIKNILSNSTALVPYIGQETCPYTNFTTFLNSYALSLYIPK